jgi:hypothetical protein
MFSNTGIYHFSLSILGDTYHAKDDVTVRFANGGEVKKLFVGKNNSFSLESEDYAYFYGDVSEISNQDSLDDKYIVLNTGDDDSSTFLEYSVGTAENKTCTIRLLVKMKDAEKATALSVDFNGKKHKSVSVSSDKEWEWVDVMHGVSVTAGQWPFLIYTESGSFYLKTIKIDFDN